MLSCELTAEQANPRIPWPIALGVLMMRTRGTNSSYWSDCVCKFIMLQCARMNSTIPFNFLPFLPTSWMWRMWDATQPKVGLKGVRNPNVQKTVSSWTVEDTLCVCALVQGCSKGGFLIECRGRCVFPGGVGGTLECAFQYILIC